MAGRLASVSPVECAGVLKVRFEEICAGEVEEDEDGEEVDGEAEAFILGWP